MAVCVGKKEVFVFDDKEGFANHVANVVTKYIVAVEIAALSRVAVGILVDIVVDSENVEVVDSDIVGVVDVAVVVDSDIVGVVDVAVVVDSDIVGVVDVVGVVDSFVVVAA